MRFTSFVVILKKIDLIAFFAGVWQFIFSGVWLVIPVDSRDSFFLRDWLVLPVDETVRSFSRARF